MRAVAYRNQGIGIIKVNSEKEMGKEEARSIKAHKDRIKRVAKYKNQS